MSDERKPDALAPVSTEPPALAPELLARVRATQLNSRSDRTWIEYKRVWARFGDWLATHGVRAPLAATPTHVEAYCIELADRLRLPSVSMAIAAIAAAFETAGLPSPTADPSVKTTLKGIRRKLGVAHDLAKREILLPELERLLNQLPDAPSPTGLRDRAMLLVGFFGAFRREALVSLELRDISWAEWGARVLVRKDKSDQEGEGLVKKIPAREGSINPAGALKAWIDWLAAQGHAQPESPLFPHLTPAGAVKAVALKPASVAALLKRLAAMDGAAPESIKSLAAHSLRIGFVTEALDAGSRVDDIQEQTGHKEVETLMKYARRHGKSTNAVFKL